jgi:hypothetical protein
MAGSDRIVDAARALTGRRPLDLECQRLVDALRERCPDAFIAEPLQAGAVAPEVSLTADEGAALYQVAFAEAAGDGGAAGDVVWTAGDSELLVHAGSVRLLLRDGFALVAVGVFCDQTNDVEVVVPFALGRPGAPLGLVMATEPVPRGPTAVVQRWGEHIVAVAWDALVQVTAGIAAAAGVDDQSQALLPAAVTAGQGGLTVLPQARHAFDRAGG